MAQNTPIQSSMLEVQPLSDEDKMDRLCEQVGLLECSNELPKDGPHDNEDNAVSFLNDNPNPEKKTHDDYVDFVPINKLSFLNLPGGYKMADIAPIVETLGKLVVKIIVKHSSPDRPEFFPGTNTPFPKGPSRGTGKIVFSERRQIGVEEWGEIKIATSRHVVFDDEEGNYTTCILNFDNQDSKVIELKCSKVKYVNTEEDNCLFICKTDDMNLVEELKAYIYDFTEIHKQIYNPNRQLNDLVLTVSHPHGFPKMVSIGSYAEPDTNRYKLVTCKGSGGAPIYRLNQEKVWVLELYSHTENGIAVSGIRR